MAETALSGRERVSRMMERRDHDRVPRYDLFWDETIRRWQSEGLVGDRATVLELLRSDLQQLCWFSPAPFPGRSEVVRDDGETQVVRDEWGALTRVWKGRTGTPEHLGFGCDSRAAWEREYRPAALATGCQLDLAEIEQNYRSAREAGHWCFLAGIEGYEVMKRMMGDEIALVAMAQDPEWVLDVSRVFTDLVIRDFTVVIEQGIQPDGVFLSGDMGYNHGTLFSPAMYRDLIRPDHERLAAWFHANGMAIIFHTDGNVNEVVDQYVEVGFDCLHPLEVNAHMDLRELAPRFGDRLSFCGNIDKVVLSSGDRERIEEEVVGKLVAGMERRGYAYHSDHSVPPGVSWEAYQWVIELLDRHGIYE